VPGLLQRREQPGAVGTAAFHRPDQPRTRAALERPGQQGGVTVRIGIDRHDGELAAEVVDQAGGVAVGMGVDTDDGVDLLCQHSHRGCCSFQAAVVVGTGLGGDT
jgi:hypothetical protein